GGVPVLARAAVAVRGGGAGPATTRADPTAAGAAGRGRTAGDPALGRGPGRGGAPGFVGWPAAGVRRRAHGDPDAVSVGDYHLSGMVGWALLGRKVDDAQMLALLAHHAR